MSQTLFITGTDTGCGKTTVGAALARHLVREGHRVACFKPVASGCQRTAQGLRNDDALALMAAANVPLAYEQVNPIALEPAIAPHIAAHRVGITMDPLGLARDILAIEAQTRLVEGAGGWMVPLGASVMTADLVRALDAKAVLVVGIRLGCINHALCSARAIEADGVQLRGWIANIMDPAMSALEENLTTLEHHLGTMLGRFAMDRGLRVGRLDCDPDSWPCKDIHQPNASDR